MALSLLQGYDTDSGSSSEDDLTVTVDKQALSNKSKRPVMKQNDYEQPPKRLKSNPSPSKSVVAKPGRPAPVDNAKEIPLPASINAMFIEREREIVHDDPALHDGRIRAFGHEKNNWASYVYIDLQDCELDEVKNFIVKELDLEPIDHHHLSVSRVVSVRHHWIDPFTKTLKENLEQGKAFPLSLDKLQVYANDDKTRTFVGLEATVGAKELQKLTASVDYCFSEYKLPPFYYPPSFHVSLGWCLGDMRPQIRAKLQKLELKLVDILEDDDDLGRVMVKNVHCKSGNKIFQFKLR
eukprot:GFUD01043270.1.p1 GENE.GFUD01043270.1~~GFUD01043270.1.p1  ORF type:complete len:295 (-),score=84.71 GFUD01043270.1:26-910(-)